MIKKCDETSLFHHCFASDMQVLGTNFSYAIASNHCTAMPKSQRHLGAPTSVMRSRQIIVPPC
ncbi:MAG: hypothetical protein ACOC07_16695, partial [Coleofasciculus sp.]